MEAEAVQFIFEMRDLQGWELLVSEVTLFEVGAIRDDERRADVLSLLPQTGEVTTITPGIKQRAIDIEELGIKPADALHVAAAEESGANVFLTCDDRLLRVARRHLSELRVLVANPLEWVSAGDGNDDT